MGSFDQVPSTKESKDVSISRAELRTRHFVRRGISDCSLGDIDSRSLLLSAFGAGCWFGKRCLFMMLADGEMERELVIYNRILAQGSDRHAFPRGITWPSSTRDIARTFLFSAFQMVHDTELNLAELAELDSGHEPSHFIGLVVVSAVYLIGNAPSTWTKGFTSSSGCRLPLLPDPVCLATQQGPGGVM